MPPSGRASGLWKWLPGAAGAMIIAAAQTPRDQAVKNLKDWFWPPSWVAIVVVALLVLYYGFLFRRQIRAIPARVAAGYRALLSPAESSSAESTMPVKSPPDGRRRGIVNEGGSVSADRATIKNQDDAITNKDGETKFGDLDIG